MADALSVSKLQQRTLELDSELKDISKDFHGYRNFVYLGRGINYPVALEGALKLKEVSYIHAEGYAAGEIKHGPIALIDKNMPVVFIAPEEDVYYRKLLGNFEEVKARGGRIIFITSDENLRLPDGRDRKIVIPKSSYLVSPMVSVIPAQFLAYHVANILGTDVDQPRNLAKVVTVE
ncbi:MAG: SIS domain-containing protein [Candidatus Dadabacteria bacterium]|nr:SIS domain-containing protein [Candidatus Dadabacteria bacterium]